MRIIPRAECGLALPRKPLVPIRLPAPEGIFVHHSVTNATSDPCRDARVIQGIGFARGFSDMSYSFVGHPNGTIIEGRGWGKFGAHTYNEATGRNYNGVSHGICYVGNTNEDPFTAAAAEAFAWLIAEGVRVGAVPRGDPLIRGHRDVDQTACPGTNAYASLEWMRRRVRELLTQPQPTPPEEDDLNEQQTEAIAERVFFRLLKGGNATTGVARDTVLNPQNPTQGYTLDFYGGIHAFGGAPPAPQLPGQGLKQFACAQELVISEWSNPPKGYVLDTWGAAHPFGGAPLLKDGPNWPGGKP